MDFSTGSLMASLLVSSIGFGVFLYGKREAMHPQIVVGLAMMGYPYFVSSPLWMILIAAVLLGGLRALS
ncbi:MAG: hypothetical protein GY711_25080 [bacterium]|nr:hypothetical protein [bacterium]